MDNKKVLLLLQEKQHLPYTFPTETIKGPGAYTPGPDNRKNVAYRRIPTLALPKSGEVEGKHPPLRSFTGTPLQIQLYSMAAFLSNHIFISLVRFPVFCRECGTAQLLLPARYWHIWQFPREP